MGKRTVTTNQLTPNKTIMIRGKLTYSRILSQIAGEELQRDMQRKAQRGISPIDKPYTTASICNAQVLYANPNQKTLEDIYADESLYQSTAQNNTGWSFSGYNKGKILPYVAVMGTDGVTVNQVVPAGELAAGLDVTLVLRVFQAKPNNGVSLDGIIVNEPIRYYNGGVGLGLAERGLTFYPVDPEELSKTQAAEQHVTTQTADVPFPMDQPQPVATPQGNPYSTQPTGEQPYQQPFMPNPNAGYQQQPMPQPGQQPMPQPGQAPMPQPPVQNNGFTGSENVGGIRYNPSDRGYN